MFLLEQKKKEEGDIFIYHTGVIRGILNPTPYRIILEVKRIFYLVFVILLIIQRRYTMKNLGERIKQAIARIEAMQEELERRLKELEEVQIDDCTHRDNTHCTLRVQTKEEEVEDLPLFTKSQLQEAASYLWRYAMDHKEYLPEENYYEPDWDILDAASTLRRYVLKEVGTIEDIQEAMELYTTLQQTKETVPFHDDPFTDNEDYGIFDEYDYDPDYSPMIDIDAYTF